MDLDNFRKAAADGASVGKNNHLPGGARGILQLCRIEDMDLHGPPGGVPAVYLWRLLQNVQDGKWFHRSAARCL